MRMAAPQAIQPITSIAGLVAASTLAIRRCCFEQALIDPGQERGLFMGLLVIDLDDLEGGEGLFQLAQHLGSGHQGLWTWPFSCSG